MREGDLTPSQYEILLAIWPKGRCGASVAEIWEVISEDREITRTTILNQVQRLETRGWLRRQPARPNQQGYACRYLVTVTPKRVKLDLARKVLDDFFDGSISDFVLSYLGSKRPDADRIQDLVALCQNCTDGKLDREGLREAVDLLACK